MPEACFAILMTGLDLVELTADLSCGSDAMDILNVVVFVLILLHHTHHDHTE